MGKTKWIDLMEERTDLNAYSGQNVRTYLESMVRVVHRKSSLSQGLDPQPVNNLATSYVISANFAGDSNPKNVTAWGTTLNGTRYPVCTTIQYGYKPASNTTTLTVTPQSTDTTTVTVTSEQLQKQAQDSGWLSTYNEFSWWYPWYRLHFVGKYNGQTMIDVGIAALPFADTANFPDTTLKARINEWLGKIALNVLTSVVVTEFALWAASNGGLLYFLLILAGYIGYKGISLLDNWDSIGGLLVSLVSTFISLSISVWTGFCSFLPANLKSLAADAESIKNVAFAFLCKLIMIPVNIWFLMTTWNQIVSLGGA